MSDPTVEAALDAFRDAIERAEANLNRPRGGQHVPFHGDFASAAPSTIRELRWWERTLRTALEQSAGSEE